MRSVAVHGFKESIWLSTIYEYYFYIILIITTFKISSTQGVNFLKLNLKTHNRFLKINKKCTGIAANRNRFLFRKPNPINVFFFTSPIAYERVKHNL